MATPKKKHLIELMIEAGVEWPEGAEYAAQDKTTNDLCFYRSKPVRRARFKDEWRPSGFDIPDGLVGRRINLQSLCSNWHQTIVTREQYAEALELAADGSGPAVEWHNPPSIEQLTADYYAKAAEADSMQSAADEALKAADDALLALEKAGELIGLVISIDTKTKHVEQQCSSAEWIIGDNCIVTDSPDNHEWVGRECVLTKIDRGDSNLTYRVTSKEGGDYWVSGIRRP